MFSSIYYQTNAGERIDLKGDATQFITSSDLVDYAWEYDDFGQPLRSADTITADVVLKQDTPAALVTARNALYAAIDADAAQGLAGRLYVGDYYLLCYVAASKKSDITSKPFVVDTWTIKPLYPAWLKETLKQFYPSDGSVEDYAYLDFAHDYPHDYSRTSNVGALNVDAVQTLHFVLRIYGAVNNPKITVGGNLYEMTTSIPEGSQLVIDSRAKTCILYGNMGQPENVFAQRGTTSYIFKKMRGDALVTSDASYRYDITLIDERSEPPWTL